MSSPEVTRPISTARSEAESRSWLQRLPAYSRSLLKIKVPVTVTLATAKHPIRNILELVPGSILHFEKLCDETLSLEVGDHRIAEGETVKVGDKFGLRLTSMVLPEERFHTVGGKSTGESSTGRAGSSQ
jgi:flagellar motor switch protein FliN/FliY